MGTATFYTTNITFASPTGTGAVDSVAGKTGVVTLDHTTDLANIGVKSHSTLDTEVNANIAARHTQGTDTTLGAMTADIDVNNNDVLDVGFIYWGDKNINGTYRKGQVGNDLLEQRRENDVWVEKAKTTP